MFKFSRRRNRNKQERRRARYTLEFKLGVCAAEGGQDLCVTAKVLGSALPAALVQGYRLVGMFDKSEDGPGLLLIRSGKV